MRWMCLPLDTTRTHPCQGSQDQFELSSKCLQCGNWNRVCVFWTELVIVKPRPGNQEINQYFPVETLASANQRWISGRSGSQQLSYIHTEDSNPEALPVAEATSTLCSPKHTQGFFFWSDFVLISCFPPKVYFIQLTVVIFMWQRQWIPGKKPCRNSKGWLLLSFSRLMLKSEWKFNRTPTENKKPHFLYLIKMCLIIMKVNSNTKKGIIQMDT